MLLYFTIENWKSFKEETTFRMDSDLTRGPTFEDLDTYVARAAAKAPQNGGEAAVADVVPAAVRSPDEWHEVWHGDRLPAFKRLGIKVLPVAAIFGANASGKSNLFKALSFVQECVVGDHGNGGNLREADPFRLDREAMARPIRFCVDLVSNEKRYELGFAVQDGAVIEEKLARHTKSREILLYEREGARIRFGKSQENKGPLESVAGKMPPDRLFLNWCKSQGTDHYDDVYEWFSKSLVMIYPDKPLSAKLLFENPDAYSSFEQLLPALDTGITRVEQRETPLSKIPLPSALKRDLEKSVREGAYHDLPLAYATAGARAVTRKNGKLLLKSLAFYHQKMDEEEFEFDPGLESNGTHHLINLLPTIILLTQRGCRQVLFIDEFERNLHSDLTRDLLDRYLVECTARSRSQLVFTTHECELMGDYELSLEEKWICERFDGESTLVSVSEFDDLDPNYQLRNTYVRGQLGGVPLILQQSLGIPEAE